MVIQVYTPTTDAKAVEADWKLKLKTYKTF